MTEWTDVAMEWKCQIGLNPYARAGNRRHYAP
jgi:hypothetical protein